MSEMEIDISSRLEIARGIADRVSKLAGIGGRVNDQRPDANNRPNTSQNGAQSPISSGKDQAIAVSESTKREFASRLLNVSFVDDTARTEMCE